MGYQIVFFDIDGTLIDEEKRLPQDAAEAIKELQETGVQVVIATGRAPYFFREIAETLGIESFISLNGSYVVYKGQTIYTRELPKQSLEKLEAIATEQNQPIVYQGGEDFFANHENHPDILESFESLKVQPPGYRQHFLQEVPIYQALLYCQADNDAFYRGAFPEFTFIRWHRLAMDVIPGGGSKAVGIREILRHANIPVANAVAFGDGLNDQEMLSFVGMGIAMGNAHETIKPFANYVTHHVSEGGIAHGLKYLGLTN